MREFFTLMIGIAVIAIIHIGVTAHISLTKWIVISTVKQECLKVN